MGRMTFGWWFREAWWPFGVGLWKEILKELGWVKDNWTFCIANDTRMSFWIDHWCGNSTLNISYTSLFEITVNKYETVAEVWDQMWVTVVGILTLSKTLMIGKWTQPLIL